MALISCHECKRQISSEADSCPQCGAKANPEKKSGCGKALAGFAIVTVILIVIASTMDSTSTPPRSPVQAAAKKAPDVSISVGARTIEVTNNGTNPWPEMTIYLNDVPGGFKFTAPAPAVGAKVRLDLARFVDKEGKRYNPALNGVIQVWIGGSGRDFEAYTVR